MVCMKRSKRGQEIPEINRFIHKRETGERVNMCQQYHRINDN